MDGLIIKQPWIDYILEGIKTWEIRGSVTHKRGKILLIQSKTQCIVGEAELIDCIQLDPRQYISAKDYHRIDTSDGKLPYSKVYAWVLANAKRYPTPIPYVHPKGAIIWVKIQS